MQHERLRPFNTRDVYPHQTLDNDMCMVVKAGNRLFMRGQTGLDLTHRLVAPEDAAGQTAAPLDGSHMVGPGRAPGDAAAQADQALQNARRLLDEAGSSLEEVCKL